MEELRQAVKQLAKEELKRANKEYPLFASNHEGQNVIREEVEETLEQMENVKMFCNSMWKSTKENCNNAIQLQSKYLYQYAIELACEAIQVAAMADKMKTSLEVKVNVD